MKVPMRTDSALIDPDLDLKIFSEISDDLVASQAKDVGPMLPKTLPVIATLGGEPCFEKACYCCYRFPEPRPVDVGL